MVEKPSDGPENEGPATRDGRLGCRGYLGGLGRGLGALCILLLLVVGIEFLTWPDVAKLSTKNPSSTAFIDRYLDSNSEEKLRWKWVGYNDISTQLKLAVVVSEDINFFTHKGFDLDEMKKAVEEAREQGKKLRGASTLTQQLAKNLWLSPSRNPLRKVREAILTVQLERQLSKHRILEIYLNVVEFGPGIFGAEAAAQAYFSHPASRLTAEQAAKLAASLPRPKTWHPGVDSRGYRHRVEIIRQRASQIDWLHSFL